MADSKISELTELAEVPANDDVLAIVDTSAGTTKKVARDYLVRVAHDDITVTGSLAIQARHVIELDSGTAIALTITGSPVIGDEIWIKREGSGAVTHTVVLSGSVTWDGTNQTANFDTDGDWLVAFAHSAIEWHVFVQSGVTFSA